MWPGYLAVITRKRLLKGGNEGKEEGDGMKYQRPGHRLWGGIHHVLIPK